MRDPMELNKTAVTQHHDQWLGMSVSKKIVK